MKRWGLLVCVVYMILLVTLFYPLAAVCWNGEFQVFKDFVWFWLIWLGVMLVGQITLLLLPISRESARPRSRRRLIFPIIVTSLLAAALHLLLITDIAIALRGDNGLGWVGGGVIEPNGLLVVVVCLYVWFFWGFVFWWFSRHRSEGTFARRVFKGLLIGSVLELLVAVPAHVACRQRGDCCAPIASFVGIATGIAIMLMCFGPGVLWLYVERVRRKRSPSNSAEPESAATTAGEKW